MSTLPILYGQRPVDQLYSRALSAAYRVHIMTDPDYAQQQDPSAWEKLWRDGKVSQAMNLRLRSVAGLEWDVEPGGESADDQVLATIVRNALERMEDFHEGRSDLAKAIFRGRSYAYIESWAQRKWDALGGDRVMEWWLPRRLKDVDKRRVRIKPISHAGRDGSRVIIQEQLWSVAAGEWQPMERRLFCRVVYDDEESRLGYGRGLMESIHFLWWVKQKVLEEGLQGLERWAQGVIIAKVDSKTRGIDTSEEVRDEFLNMLDEMRARHVVAMDSMDDIKVEFGSGQGSAIVKDFLTYIDDSLLATILGAVLPFGGGQDTGSYARAIVEEGTSEGLVQFDRKKIDDCITRDVIGLFLEMNTESINSLGLLGAQRPKFRTTQQKREDPQRNAAIIAQLLQAGVTLPLEEIYNRTGFRSPEEGEETLGGQGMAQPGFPGLFPGSPSGFPGAVGQGINLGDNWTSRDHEFFQDFLEKNLEKIPEDKREAYFEAMARAITTCRR